MANRVQQEKSRKRPKRTRHKPGTAGILAVFLGICLVVAGALLYTGNFRITKSADPAAGQQPTDRKPTAAVASGEYRHLVGRWVRPDGGYVIDIRNIAADGTMETYYYNPRAIKVSRAKVARVGATTQVFLELRDVGYPGATYNLVYKPQENVLAGVYFQPAVGESFNVVFVRKQ